MATISKNIIPSKYAESAQTTQYIASSTRCVIDKFTAINTSASDITISVYLVPFGFTYGDDNVITKSKTINPSEIYSFYEICGHVLEPGGFISTIASIPNALSIRASGREFI